MNDYKPHNYKALKSNWIKCINNRLNMQEDPDIQYLVLGKYYFIKDINDYFCNIIFTAKISGELIITIENLNKFFNLQNTYSFDPLNANKMIDYEKLIGKWVKYIRHHSDSVCNIEFKIGEFYKIDDILNIDNKIIFIKIISDNKLNLYFASTEFTECFDYKNSYDLKPIINNVSFNENSKAIKLGNYEILKSAIIAKYMTDSGSAIQNNKTAISLSLSSGHEISYSFTDNIEARRIYDAIEMG